MIKKTVLGVCGLVFVAALSFPAFADQSKGFRQYFNEGVHALNDHDDQKALRCFKIAHIYDPDDQGTSKYISILEQRGVVLEVSFSKPPETSIGYRYYLGEGTRAYQLNDYKEAIRYFKIAKIFYPDSREVDRYLDILSQLKTPPVQPPTEMISLQPAVAPSVAPIEQTAPQQQLQPQYSAPSVQTTPKSETQTVSQPSVAISQPQQAQPYSSPAEQSYSQPAVSVPVKEALYVGPQNPKMPPVVLSLAQITNNGQVKPRIRIEFHSSVIIEGKNIQRFLIVNEGFIRVKTLDADRIQVDALRIGNTFLHIWDAFGRHTLYVEVVFPKTVSASAILAMGQVEHAQPFEVTYANDWSTYYQGKDVAQLKRQSYDFNQYIGITGETPYGFVDASGSYMDFNSFSQFDTYTIGLSQIPVEGVSNFNLRGFDSFRYLSPLTMPGTRLRGAFADIYLMDDLIGLSVSHGQEQVPLGFLSANAAQFNHAYIDAVKLTLFPRSESDRYSINFATGYGPDRQAYLSNHVYSLQGQHKFNDFLTLSAETANDSSHDASLASLKWEQGAFRSFFNFRDIDKDYSTVSTLPANQGEIGAAWVTEGDFKNYRESTFVETYRDRLNFNPDHPEQLNYDANAHLRSNINENWWSDSDFNYVDTPGELSPQRNLQLNERLSRSFGVWNSQKGTVFAGVGYQNSHSPGSTISNYDRDELITGVQLPLLNHLSAFANYEYDWLHQPDTGNSNPNIINAGLEYSKQFNPKFSITSQVVYRDERGVKPNANSFLSGQQSVILSSGFAYNPTPDVSIFGDGDASRVLSHIGDPAYDDFEVHVGLRITFGGTTYWDPLGTVSGIVFKDSQGSGQFTAGDEGIAGVKVKVGDKVAVTDKNGHYRIQVRAKGVQVFPIMDTLPGGLIFSTPQVLNVEILQGRTRKADFGLISQTGIYGIIFVDKNGSGTPNDKDQFVGKVKVILDGKVIQKSDSHGAFYFRKVSPGEHIISIDINTLAINMVPTIKLKNKINVAEGTNYNFNIPVKIKKAQGGQE